MLVPFTRVRAQRRSVHVQVLISRPPAAGFSLPGCRWCGRAGARGGGLLLRAPVGGSRPQLVADAGVVEIDADAQLVHVDERGDAADGRRGMGGMMRMSCTNTIQASTAGLKPGSTHTLIALLVDNQHVPLMPMVATQVSVRIAP